MAKMTVCRACGRDFEKSYRAASYVYCKRCTARSDREIARPMRMDCRECGKAFSPKTHAVRYCSDECRASAVRRIGAESRRRHMADPEKRARRLAGARASYAATYTARARVDKQPRRASRDAASPRRNAKAAEPYPCVLCGRNIAPPCRRGRRTIYCKRCTAKANRELGREMTLNCKECGKKFTTSNRTVRYCSDACRADVRRRDARECARRRLADPEMRALAAARARAQLAARRGKEKESGRQRNA